MTSLSKLTLNTTTSSFTTQRPLATLLIVPLHDAEAASESDDLNTDVKFIDILFRVAENGFASDIRQVGGLCKATWREEGLWSRLSRVQHGVNLRTRLSSSAMRGDSKRVAWLLARRADVSATDSSGWTALHHAAYRGHAEVVRLLLSHVPPTLPRSPRAIRTQIPPASGLSGINALAHGLWTPLAWAAHEGFAETVAVLLAAGADVHLPNRDLLYPLHHAVRSKSLQCVQLLVDAGADVNATAHGVSVLHYAARADVADILTALIAAGAVIDLVGASGVTPLMWAVLEGSDSCITLLLNAGARTNLIDNAGATALHIAARYERASALRVLLSRGGGALINARAIGGWTALHYAVLANCSTCVSTLLEFGAELNTAAVTNEDGKTPLMLAAEIGVDSEIIVQLLTYGANIDTQNRSNGVNTCALHYACAEGHLDTVRIFLERGADLLLTFQGGHSCLHAAVISTITIQQQQQQQPQQHEQRRLSIIDLLCHREPKLLIMMNTDGASPFQCAVQCGCQPIIDKLAILGATQTNVLQVRNQLQK